MKLKLLLHYGYVEYGFYFGCRPGCGYFEDGDDASGFTRRETFISVYLRRSNCSHG